MTFLRKEGFTLIELVIIILILGILAIIAAVRYVDLRKDSAKSVADGILGALRGANELIYSKRVVSGIEDTYTMGDVVHMISLSGADTYLSGDRTLIVTIKGYVYTYTMDTYGSAPKTLPKIDYGKEGNGGGGCFIATSAYSDKNHPHVIILKAFRDRYLLKSKIGKSFVCSYYKYSPYLVSFLEKNPELKPVIRLFIALLVLIISPFV